MTFWILVAESILFGMMILFSLPVWAVIPVLFGMTLPASQSRKKLLFLLIVAFPIVTLVAMGVGFWLAADSPLRWVCIAAPPVHLVLLCLLRIKPPPGPASTESDDPSQPEVERHSA